MALIDDTDDGTDGGAPDDRFEQLLRDAVRIPDAALPEPRVGLAVTPQLRLTTRLGAGGMGSVWAAHHSGLDTHVAVKFMRSRSDDDAERSARRFEREAKMAARVKHPHVVEIHDHGAMADGTPFIVMELLEGESLEARLAREGYLELQLARRLVTQVADALQTAHESGVVHRDIKPANLFLVAGHRDVFVKILDFGVAKRRARNHSNVTSTGAMVGTPAYMSPEQLIDAREADERSDLWGLAVVVYEALTGNLPFSGRTVAALGHAIAQGGFAKARSVRAALPASIDAWFARALSVDPARRYPSAASMAGAFELAAEGRAPRKLRHAAVLGAIAMAIAAGLVLGSGPTPSTLKPSGHSLSVAPEASDAPPPPRLEQAPSSPTIARALPSSKPTAAPTSSAAPTYCDDDEQAFYTDEQGHLALRPECR